jgi:hypothetical protein
VDRVLSLVVKVVQQHGWVMVDGRIMSIVDLVRFIDGDNTNVSDIVVLLDMIR